MRSEARTQRLRGHCEAVLDAGSIGELTELRVIVVLVEELLPALLHSHGGTTKQPLGDSVRSSYGGISMLTLELGGQIGCTR